MTDLFKRVNAPKPAPTSKASTSGMDAEPMVCSRQTLVSRLCNYQGRLWGGTIKRWAVFEQVRGCRMGGRPDFEWSYLPRSDLLCGLDPCAFGAPGRWGYAGEGSAWSLLVSIQPWRIVWSLSAPLSSRNTRRDSRKQAFGKPRSAEWGSRKCGDGSLGLPF